MRQKTERHKVDWTKGRMTKGRMDKASKSDFQIIFFTDKSVFLG